MANTAQMLQGNTVYGKGSYAPNTGHVSAQGVQGYLQRDMANKSSMVSSVGGDGQSDTRSGAAAALQGQFNSNSGPVAGTSQGQQPQQQVDPNSYAAPTPVGSPLYSSTVTSPVTPSAVPTGVTGKLSLPGNIDYSNAVIGAYGSLSDQLNQTYNNAVANETEYAQNMNELNKGYAEQQGNTRAAQGGQGTLYSSANATAIQKDLDNYNDQSNKQTTEYQKNRNAFQNTAQTLKNNWSSQLDQAAKDDAAKKAAAAKARAEANAAKKAADKKSAKQKKDNRTSAQKMKDANKALNNPQGKAMLKNFEREFGFKVDGVLGAKSLAEIKKRAKDPKNLRANALLAMLQGRTKDADKAVAALKRANRAKKAKKKKK